MSTAGAARADAPRVTGHERVAALEAPVARTLAGMSAPIAVGMLSTFLFQLVDTYFVGRLGIAELASLAFSATVYLFLVSLFIGMSVGVSSLVGRAVGAGDMGLARTHASAAVLAASVLSTGLSVVGIASVDVLFAELGAPIEMLPLVSEYISAIYFGLPFIAVGLVASGAVRASGWVTAPEVVFAVAGVINVVADYALIFGAGPIPAFGLRGAAMATVASWSFLFAGTLWLMFRRGLLGVPVLPLGRSLAELWRMATPAVVAQVLLPITGIALTWVLARISPDAVAAFGIASRLELLGLIGVSSLSVALVPFVAQNVGADAGHRVDAARRVAGEVSLAWGIGLFLILAVAAEPLAGVFTDDPSVVAYAALYLRVVGFSYAAYGFVLTSAAVLNGAQRTGHALRLLAVRSLVLAVPLAALGGLLGAWAVFGGLAAGNIAGAVYARRDLRRCGLR